MTIVVEPLTGDRIAPFGAIIAQDGASPLQRFDMVYDHGGRARTQGFALVTIETGVSLPLRIHRLERHPHSAQTFLPLLNGASLIFVCESGADGEPRVETGRAFLATDRQGVCYRRGVWHHRLSPLQAPAQFGVIMTHADEGEDTDLRDLAQPVVVSR